MQYPCHVSRSLRARFVVVSLPPPSRFILVSFSPRFSPRFWPPSPSVFVSFTHYVVHASLSLHSRVIASFSLRLSLYTRFGLASWLAPGSLRSRLVLASGSRRSRFVLSSLSVICVNSLLRCSVYRYILNSINQHLVTSIFYFA